MDNPTGSQNPMLAEKRRRTAPSAGTITGAVLVIGGVAIGVAGTPLAMMHAFHELGDSGIGDPSALAWKIGLVLDIPIAGACAAVVGVIVLVVSQVMRRRRENDQ
jgi:hypothetical protein